MDVFHFNFKFGVQEGILKLYNTWIFINRFFPSCNVEVENRNNRSLNCTKIIICEVEGLYTFTKFTH